MPLKAMRQLIGRRPIFGICLGHQILGLALGFKTYKLKFGHHGANHPVMDLEPEQVEITSQNHNFAVQSPELPEGIPDRPPLLDSDFGRVAVTHMSLNDQSIEGLACWISPCFRCNIIRRPLPGPMIPPICLPNLFS